MPLRIIFLLAAILLFPLPATARTVTVNWPITLDYPFIRAMLVSQFFTQPNERAVAARAEAGCTLVELWAPRAGPEGHYLKIGVRVRVKAGVRFLNSCLEPIDWQGYVELLQKVHVDKLEWRLRFETVASRIYDRDLQPAKVGSVVWKLIKNQVHAYLDQFTIDLAPPVKDLEVQLPLLFKPGQAEKVKEWLATLRLGQARVGVGAIKVGLAMDVDAPRPVKHEPAPTKPATEEQIAAFTRYWQAWDAFLIHEIRALAGQPLLPGERDELLSVVLDTRYGFEQALRRGQTGKDLVRKQFLQTWSRLAPIFRANLLRRSSPSLLNYLAFFTAADALAALDALGPAIGLDISYRGLVRLARLVDRAGRYPELDYSYKMDHSLRFLLGLGPPIAETGPMIKEDAIDLAPSPPSQEQSGFWLWGARPAWAGEGRVPPGIMQWLPPQGEPGPYLERVRSLLLGVLGRTLKDKSLDRRHHTWFRELAQATAWQESCWRQFLRMNGKATYLRSYNKSSVGLMQINERVWRGLYRQEALRWSIAYNARAGCEILKLYTTRYALRPGRGSKALQGDELAQAVYAMYNGGPGQLGRFQRRLKRKKLLLSDRLFAEKLHWVQQGNFRMIHRCLGGAPPKGS